MIGNPDIAIILPARDEEAALAPTPETASIFATFLAWTPSQQAPEAHEMPKARSKRGVMWLAGKYPPPENW